MLERDCAFKAKLRRRLRKRGDRNRIIENVTNPMKILWLRHDLELAGN